MKKNHRLNTILIIALTLGFGFTISVVNAGPPIAVTSAVPDEAEQGFKDLTVIINGRGFDQLMEIKFCRSESTEACEPGGVDVKGSVEFISSKQLRVTVDVDVNADIGNFDIEATSLSSPGRRGRGIEKFSVLKVGGGASELLQASFDLTIFYTDQMAIESDGDPYQDSGKDHVQVSTGPVPGLRFDTNLQNDHRQRKFAKTRLVFMDITGSAQDRVAFEIDFRFDLPSGGLDLGSLVAEENGLCPGGGCTGTVAAWLRYYAGAAVATAEIPDQNWGKLGFGAIHANINDIGDPQHDAARECLAPTAAPESRKILVTRTSAETWTLESNADGKACRFLLEGSGDAECTNGRDCSFDASDEIDFKFKFELEIQPE